MRKDEILSILKPTLEHRLYLPQDAASATPSAVLVIIHYYHYHHDRPHVFMTKRSSTLKSHRGEISFPEPVWTGGGMPALRVEGPVVGLWDRSRLEQVVGNLRAVRTMTSNHFIVPFIALQDSLPEHRIAASEVEAVIDAPLLETLATIEPDTEHYLLAKDAFKFTYNDNVIWGATARIMKQLHDLLISR